MTVVKIMAAALSQELHARGIVALGRADCEVIIGRVIERTAAAANASGMTAEQADDISKRSS